MGYNMLAEYAEVFLKIFLMKVHFKSNSACFLDSLFQEKKKQNKKKKNKAKKQRLAEEISYGYLHFLLCR